MDDFSGGGKKHLIVSLQQIVEVRLDLSVFPFWKWHSSSAGSWLLQMGTVMGNSHVMHVKPKALACFGRRLFSCFHRNIRELKIFGIQLEVQSHSYWEKTSAATTQVALQIQTLSSEIWNTYVMKSCWLLLDSWRSHRKQGLIAPCASHQWVVLIGSCDAMTFAWNVRTL